MSDIDQAGAPRPPWRPLLGEGLLRRLLRLAAMREEDEAVWVGEGGERSVKVLVEAGLCRASTRPSLDGARERSLGLIIAPQLVADLGLERSLTLARPFLAIDAVLAVVVRSYIGDLPLPVRRHWEHQQPEVLLPVKGVMSRFTSQGYEPLTTELIEEPRLSEHDRSLLGTEAAEGRRGTTLGLFIGRRVEPGSLPRWPRRGSGGE